MSDRTFHEIANDAAGRLPAGWEIRVTIGREAGYVELEDPDGHEVDFGAEGEAIEDQVVAATERAIRLASDGQEGP